MARSRNIKPGFCQNEHLAELSTATRLLFALLPMFADREGRLEDRPKRIGIQIFPYDRLDLDEMLQSLHQSGFILRYEAEGKRYIQIVNFVKHQNPHHKELASVIPPPEGHKDSGAVPCEVTPGQRQRIMDRDRHQCVACGSKNDLQVDHITPVSKGGTSEDSNLQILCVKCNASKGNRHERNYNNPSTKRQRAVNEASKAPDVPLIPDSLNSDSLNLSKEGAAAPTFWDVAVGIGIPRALIGKLIKQHSEAKVAEAIAACAIKRPADARQFLVACLQERPAKLFVPKDDAELVPFAKANGLPEPGKTETYHEYRQRLWPLVKERNGRMTT